MKKWLILALAAVMSFSMIACGNKKEESKETPPTAQEEIADGEQGSAFSVHISINPEFVIYVGADEKVYKVECGNKDAQAVLDQVDVTGKDCEKAAYLIIKETINQGFLKEDAKIEVTLSLPPEMGNQVNDWTDKVQQSVTRGLEEENVGAQLVIGAEIVEPEEENIPGTTKSTEEQEETPGETDANGNTIIQQDDGMVLVVDKDGKVLQRTEPDGAVIYCHYDAQGKLVSEEVHHSVGVVTLRKYDGNGALISEEDQNPDGSKCIRNYDASRKVVSEERIYPDQSYYYTYDNNGQVLTEVERLANGFSREKYYHQNGVLAREYQVWANGEYKDESYDPSGKITQRIYAYAQGREERTFRADGSSYAYFYDPSGSVFFYEIDANDRQLLDTYKQIK